MDFLKSLKWIEFFATMGYTGKSPFAPGTIGTLLSIPIWWALTLLGPLGYIVSTLLFCILAIFISQHHETHLGRHDSSEIVIDEVAGLLVTMALLPVTWKTAILGFLLFRILDIVKPFPISLLDKKVQGGFGVVIDDLAAGLLANMILQFLYQWQPHWLSV